VVKFIQMNCDETIDLRRKTEEECTAILGDAGLERQDDSFEYLLKLPIRSLTAEMIAKHTAELKALLATLDTIQATSPSAMWTQDLNALVV
jgi:hypothetical protein